MKKWYKSRTLWLLAAFLILWIGSWLMDAGADVVVLIGAAESLILACLRMATSEAIEPPKAPPTPRYP